MYVRRVCHTDHSSSGIRTETLIFSLLILRCCLSQNILLYSPTCIPLQTGECNYRQIKIQRADSDLSVGLEIVIALSEFNPRENHAWTHPCYGYSEKY